MKKILPLLFVLSEINMQGQECGPLDPAFGTVGRTFGFVGTSAGRAPSSSNLLIQPDNKIVQTISVFTGFRYDFGLIRYRADGKLDSAFGTNGVVSAAVGATESQAAASALQADGKIVSAGAAIISGYMRGFALVRYHSNGKVDSSFGVNGRVLTQVGTSYDYADAIAIQPDGKIVVAGASFDSYFTAAFAILRYNNDGSIDNSFGQNGKIITHPGPRIEYIGEYYFGRHADEYASAVLVQGDGKIVVAGKSYSHTGCYDYYGGIYCNPAAAVIRFNNDGTVDSSFGTNGKVMDSVNLLYPNSVVLQNDEKIIVSGSGYNAGIVTGRFKTDGSADSSFGNNGITITLVSPAGNTWGADVAIQPDDKIVAAGTTGYDLTVARYLVDGTPDNTFNGTGVAVFHMGETGTSDVATGVAIQDNKVIVGGNSFQNNFGSIGVSRLLENGQPFTPVIAANGPLQFCNGGTVKLSVTETGSIQWYRDNTALMNANETSLLVFSGGWYKVRVTNNQGCAFSSPVLVTTNDAFTPTIFANGTTSFCIGDSVMLVSNAYSYWYKDGTEISGYAGHNLIAKESGIYTAKTKNSGCASLASNPVGVTVNTTIPPAPVISAAGNTAFCGGQSLLLSSNSASGNQWYLNGGPITGATGITFSAVSAGTYTVKVLQGGCQSPASNSISTTVYSQPVKPVISWSTPDFSTAPGHVQYQWYFNNNLISGIDTNVYRPTQTGTYKVVVTDNNNCTNSSDDFVLWVLAASEIQIGDSKLRYYPNPVRSILHIDVNNAYLRELKAKVYDASGRLVHKQSLAQGQNQLGLQSLPTGFYQLVIHNDSKTVAVKFIKAW